MNLIDNITDQANQQTRPVLDDGSIMTINLMFNGSTQRWTMDLSHPLITVNGINVCNFPNLLRDWRNLINFGLACITVSGQDPVNVEDFVNGNASLYILNSADVEAAEASIFGGVLQ